MDTRVTIRCISMDDPLYAQERALRLRVLLEPIGMSWDDLLAESPGREERFEHFVALLDHPEGARVVGCCTLLPPAEDAEDKTRAKVMQVAVDRQLQRGGIGRMLMAAAERRAFGELGMTTLYLHAQMPAVPFYERLGWIGVGEVFQEAGIDHLRMELAGAGEPVDPTAGMELG